MKKALTVIAHVHKTGQVLRFYRLRNEAHKLAEDYCSVPMTEEEYAERLKAIEIKACRLFEVNKLPDCIDISGDPRGWVLKVDGEKIDEAEKALLRNAGLSRDWGGNFMIGYADRDMYIKNKEA